MRIAMEKLMKGASALLMKLIIVRQAMDVMALGCVLMVLGLLV